MLRSIGISEGIAANEAEYVEWAVRFAKDADLRLRVKKQIKQRAKETFFDGAGAQSAYESALLRIFEEHQLRPRKFGKAK